MSLIAKKAPTKPFKKVGGGRCGECGPKINWRKVWRDFDNHDECTLDVGSASKRLIASLVRKHTS